MLFNRDNNGSDELYRITGIFPASAQFESIAPDIDGATMEVTNLIGDDIMKIAISSYEDPFKEKDRDDILMERVRFAVASLAIMKYSKMSTLSHGEAGRKIKVDEGEKIPFQWMLDRDDDALRERYYQAMNQLFSYINSQEKYQAKCSNAHDLKECIVKDVHDFERVYPIDGSNYVFFMMLPLMVDAQRHLQQTVPSGVTLEENPEAKKYVVLSALAKALGRWSITIFPLRLARQFSPSYQGNKDSMAASAQEIEGQRKRFEEEAKGSALAIRRSAVGNDIRLTPENDKRNKFFTV